MNRGAKVYAGGSSTGGSPERHRKSFTAEQSGRLSNMLSQAISLRISPISPGDGSTQGAVSMRFSPSARLFGGRPIQSDICATPSRKNTERRGNLGSMRSNSIAALSQASTGNENDEEEFDVDESRKKIEIDIESMMSNIQAESSNKMNLNTVSKPKEAIQMETPSTMRGSIFIQDENMTRLSASSHLLATPLLQDITSSSPMTASKDICERSEGMTDRASYHTSGKRSIRRVSCDNISRQSSNISRLSFVSGSSIISNPEGKLETGNKEEAAVLIVDDSAANRKMLGRLMRGRSAVCEVAEDGQEAVDRINQMKKDNITLYDIILMDWEMPRMNGPTATKTLREIGYQGLIIGLTGNTGSEEVKEFISHGADHVLCKPLEIEKYDKIVKEYKNSH